MTMGTRSFLTRHGYWRGDFKEHLAAHLPYASGQNKEESAFRPLPQPRAYRCGLRVSEEKDDLKSPTAFGRLTICGLLLRRVAA